MPKTRPFVSEIYQNLIQAVYRKFNADKCGDIPRIMEKYKGMEADIYDRIVRKYVFENEAAGERYWRPLIEATYRRFNPSKLSELSSLLRKYKDNEAKLYRALCDKYIPTVEEGEIPLDFDVWASPSSSSSAGASGSESPRRTGAVRGRQPGGDVSGEQRPATSPRLEAAAEPAGASPEDESAAAAPKIELRSPVKDEEGKEERFSLSPPRQEQPKPQPETTACMTAAESGDIKEEVPDEASEAEPPTIADAHDENPEEPAGGSQEEDDNHRGVLKSRSKSKGPACSPEAATREEKLSERGASTRRSEPVMRRKVSSSGDRKPKLASPSPVRESKQTSTSKKLRRSSPVRLKSRTPKRRRDERRVVSPSQAVALARSKASAKQRPKPPPTGEAAVPAAVRARQGGGRARGRSGSPRRATGADSSPSPLKRRRPWADSSSLLSGEPRSKARPKARPPLPRHGAAAARAAQANGLTAPREEAAARSRLPGSSAPGPVAANDGNPKKSKKPKASEPGASGGEVKERRKRRRQASSGGGADEPPADAETSRLAGTTSQALPRVGVDEGSAKPAAGRDAQVNAAAGSVKEPKAAAGAAAASASASAASVASEPALGSLQPDGQPRRGLDMAKRELLHKKLEEAKRARDMHLGGAPPPGMGAVGEDASRLLNGSLALEGKKEVASRGQKEAELRAKLLAHPPRRLATTSELDISVP